MAGPLALIQLLAFFCLFLNAAHVQARPTAIGNILNFSGPSTAQTTTQTTDSNGNPIIQTCSITFTASGTDNVVMVESCVDTPVNGGGNGGGGSGGGGGSSTTVSTTDASTSKATTTTTASASVDTSVSTGTGSVVSSTATDTGSSAPPGTTSAPPATATVGGAFNIGTSSMAVTLFPSAPASSTVASPSVTGTASKSGTAASEVASTTATSTTSGTVAAASVAAAINTSLPGKSISVLPIGLGVFAGLSVIAMIVVGAVTYERTKYRKNFRAQKLAEAGGSMGYGGMAQARV